MTADAEFFFEAGSDTSLALLVATIGVASSTIPCIDQIRHNRMINPTPSVEILAERIEKRNESLQWGKSSFDA